MEKRTWLQLPEKGNMVREVMERYHSQKKINALSMQEFNLLVIHLVVPYKNCIKDYYITLNNESKKNSKSNNHVIFNKSIQKNWEKTIKPITTTTKGTLNYNIYKT